MRRSLASALDGADETTKRGVAMEPALATSLCSDDDDNDDDND